MAPSAQSIAKVCLFGRLAKKFKVKVCLRYKIKVKKLIKLLMFINQCVIRIVLG